MGCGSAKISNSNSRNPGGAATTDESTALTEVAGGGGGVGASPAHRRRSYGFLAGRKGDLQGNSCGDSSASPVVCSGSRTLPRSPITPHNEYATATSITGSAKIRVTLSRDGSVLQIETERLDCPSAGEEDDPQPSTSGLGDTQGHYASRDYFSTSSSSSSSGTASLTSASGGCWPRTHHSRHPPTTIHASLQDLKEPGAVGAGSGGGSCSRDIPRKLHQSSSGLRHSASADVESRGSSSRAGRTPVLMVQEEGDEGIDLRCEGCEECCQTAAVAGIHATTPSSSSTTPSPSCLSYRNCDRLPGGRCDCSCDPGGGGGTSKRNGGLGRELGNSGGGGGARRKHPPPPPRPPRPTCIRPYRSLDQSDTAHVPNHHTNHQHHSHSLAHTRRRFQRQTSLQDNYPHGASSEHEVGVSTAIVHSSALPNGPTSAVVDANARFPAKSAGGVSTSGPNQNNYHQPPRVNTSRSMPSALSSAASLDYYHRRNHSNTPTNILNGGPANGAPLTNGPTMNGSVQNGAGMGKSLRVPGGCATMNGAINNRNGASTTIGGASNNNNNLKVPSRPPPPNMGNRSAAGSPLSNPDSALSLSLPSPVEYDARERSLEEFEGLQRRRNPREEEEDYIVDAFDFAAALLPFVDSAVLEQAADTGDYTDPAIVLVTIHQDFFNDFGDYFDEDDIGGLEETHI